MTTQKKLVFFGTEAFSVPALQSLVDAGYNIAAVVTKPDTRRGRGHKTFVHPVKQLALDHKIPVLQPVRLKDIDEELTAIKAEAAVLVSYGKIIPSRTLNLFGNIGIINIHPSRLPKYRGPSPIEATILAGDTSTAISIMQLDQGMDTGPVYAQLDVPLTGSETKPELSDKLSRLGAELLVDTLPSILSGDLKPKPQSNDDVSVTSLISKQDGTLDPTTDAASVLERKIRAYQGYPKPRLTIKDIDVIITSAKIAESLDDGPLTIACAQNTWLKVEKLIAPSGRVVSARAFLNGQHGRDRKIVRS